VPAENRRPDAIQTSDEFDRPAFGLQWQWHANPRPSWADLDGSRGALRLRAVARDSGNFWCVPNLLLQKFPAAEFSATTRLALHSEDSLDAAGLIVMGTDYARLSLRRTRGGSELSLLTCLGADRGGVERESSRVPVEGGAVHLRVSVGEGALCRFSYSSDGTLYRPIGGDFQATAGAWIGAKVGLYCVAEESAPNPGHAEVDWFRVETK
jgi:beta-xylosidase